MQHLVYEGKKTSESRDSRVVIEKFLASVNLLFCDPEIGSILKRLDTIPTLQKEIEHRKEQSTIDEQLRSKALNDYDKHRDKWKVEKQGLKDQIEALQRDLVDKKKIVESLGATNASQIARIKDLEDSSAKQIQDVENNRKHIQGLVKAIEVERKEKVKSGNALEGCKTHISKLESEFKDLEKRYSKVEKQADRSMKEIQSAASLTVPLSSDLKM